MFSCRSPLIWPIVSNAEDCVYSSPDSYLLSLWSFMCETSMNFTVKVNFNGVCEVPNTNLVHVEPLSLWEEAYTILGRMYLCCWDYADDNTFSDSLVKEYFRFITKTPQNAFNNRRVDRQMCVPHAHAGYLRVMLPLCWMSYRIVFYRYSKPSPSNHRTDSTRFM